MAVYALSSDGMLHSLNVANGADVRPAVKFLPANANAHGLIVVDDTAYVATAQGCGGVPDAMWGLALTSQETATWKSSSGGVVGFAFGPDGTLFVATAGGDLVALEAKTLKHKNSYRSGGPAFTSSPVVFQYKEKVLLAAATGDGRIHLLDTAALDQPLGGPPMPSIGANFAPGALASWVDAAGMRWLLAPVAAPPAADSRFTAANGPVTKGAIAAWKLAELNGVPAFMPGWLSRDMTSPLPPMVINGVVFAVSSGVFRTPDSAVTAAERARRSSPAVLYALDGTTGRELWNSGTAITSFVHGAGLSGGASQLYIGAYDGTLYSFGFPIEH